MELVSCNTVQGVGSLREVARPRNRHAAVLNFASVCAVSVVSWGEERQGGDGAGAARASMARSFPLLGPVVRTPSLL
jgi:predicted DNA-binding ribbon-helix-helix protein